MADSRVLRLLLHLYYRGTDDVQNGCRRVPG